MYGFDPGAMQPENSPDAALKRLAQMLRDVGFGPSAALKRLLMGQMVPPTGGASGPLGAGGALGGGVLGGGSGGSSSGGVKPNPSESGGPTP